MESEFLNKVEDNAVIRIWSERSQLEKGDSLTMGHASELWDYTSINVTQNNLQELKEIWAQWDDEVKQLFYCNYGDLPYLLDINVDEHLFRALAQFWNSAYSCFTFGKVDMVPTVEEYTTLLRCPRIQVDKIYCRAANVLTLTKKLTRITGMSEQWVTARIKQKGENRCIPWRSLRDQILAHPDTKKKVDVFALSMYGMVIFPKALGHIDEAVTDLFDQLDRRVTPVPAILAETFRSLSACRRTGEGRFELAATSRRDDITEERWMTILQNLRDEDVEWRASWMVPDEIMYRCGDFDWVPLLGIWGAVGYAPLLVLRQYRSRQFVPATQGLAECEFSYKGNNYRGKIREMSNAWKQIHRMKGIAVGATTTPEYHG
ncbi:uncharacterized protein [Gossypium hirsutum]|uniref:DUF7745 domain-containing protein n=1 Tax=Gossypium hirsutum TaxID=3635 RepID=A0ABM3AD78_GOSHI|nr:uncharacterized protein LOC121219157 [Gossypium hirsutum]